jgi:hypothetical protein
MERGNGGERCKGDIEGKQKFIEKGEGLEEDFDGFISFLEYFLRFSEFKCFETASESLMSLEIVLTSITDNFHLFCSRRFNLSRTSEPNCCK